MENRIAQIKKMMETDPNDSFLVYALALEQEKEGKIKDAIKTIEELMQKDPAYLGAYYKLGKLYESLSKEEAAKKTYLKGIELAKKIEDNKTRGELEEALWLIED